MTYEIKGDYFHNNFNLPPIKGLDSSYILLKKINPSNTTEILWQCPADSRHIIPVIESADEGFKCWKKTPLKERLTKIKTYLLKIEERKNEIASTISLETGRPVWETLQEVKQSILGCTSLINNCEKHILPAGLLNLSSKDSENSRVIYRPIGPTLIITAFCSPFLIPNNYLTNSLIAGNSVILKPSPETCYTSQIIMECFQAAEFPNGVINSIQGDSEISRRLLKEKSIKCVFFVGTNESGNKVIDATQNDLHKMISLNLGSKNTTIIHHDTDINFAIKDMLVSSFLSSGQNCRSTSLIAIHKNIQEEFVTKFHQLAKKIIIDDPINFEKEPFMGPLINQQSVDNYILFIGMAKREGFEEVMRGKQIDKKNPGYYVTPSIQLTSKFDKKSRFLTSEILAPTATFIPYQDIEEAIDIANSTEYGLVSSVYTNHSQIKEKCLDELQSGTVNINVPTTNIEQDLPSLGIKNSGNHRAAFTAAINSCVYPLSIVENDSKKSNQHLIGFHE